MGVCSEIDNFNIDCGLNGYCIIYVDDYGVVKIVCKCKFGYYGVNCDSKWNLEIIIKILYFLCYFFVFENINLNIYLMFLMFLFCIKIENIVKNVFDDKKLL